MRVRGDQSPPGAFSVENQPDRPGHKCVRFFENARNITETDEGTGEKTTFWEYDEYMLCVPDRPGLIEAIETNFDEWLLTAKSHSLEAIAIAEADELRQATDILMGVQP